MTKPDPYAEFRSLAMTLESEGVDVDTIIDACRTEARRGRRRRIEAWRPGGPIKV
jgi:hypothetical protein